MEARAAPVGSGGSVGGSGGSVGGSGGSVGGMGGSVGGMGGSVGGMGGSVGGASGAPADTCPPMPSCNWCGGSTVYDANGCWVQYVCANGADPCATDPCFEPYDCGPGETCIDMLCWPGALACTETECDGYMDPNGNGGCDCGWTCNDGNDYRTHCETYGSGFSCDCYVNGMSNTSCGSGGGTGGGPMIDPCSVDCCGFPK